MKLQKEQVTRRVTSSGYIVAMIEIRGRIYAATYAPGSIDVDMSDDEAFEIISNDYRKCGHGRGSKQFRPYDQSQGVYL